MTITTVHVHDLEFPYFVQVLLLCFEELLIFQALRQKDVSAFDAAFVTQAQDFSDLVGHQSRCGVCNVSVYALVICAGFCAHGGGA